jgi:gluconate 5-dehydrogenase
MMETKIVDTEKISRQVNRMYDLSGKVAIVTGGAGGLGAPVCTALASAGADVVVVDMDLKRAELVAEEIKSLGRKSMALRVDVTKEDEVKKMVRDVIEKLKRVDILIPFAGMNIPKPAEDYPLEDWNKVITLNVTGTFLCDREVGKVMVNQRSGKIINISSVRSAFALPRNYLGYCTSKGAVNMITKQLACEWGKFNVNVNAIAPTVIETPLTAHILADREFAEKLRRGIPLGRWGRPDDLFGTIVFLCSEASNFVTGQIIFIDGGTTTFDSID